jgi:hypothetical protein
MKKLWSKVYRWVAILATYLNIPSDKVLHFLCSLVITVALGLFLSPLDAVLVALAVGVSKEGYDCMKMDATGWDWLDLLADAVGIMVGVILIEMVV